MFRGQTVVNILWGHDVLVITSEGQLYLELGVEYAHESHLVSSSCYTESLPTHYLTRQQQSRNKNVLSVCLRKHTLKKTKTKCF